MKGKLLLTATMASLLASSAFATVSRESVFGTQPIFQNAGGVAGTNQINNATVTGSLWYDDDYNVFYNPSYVMDNKNYVVIEKGVEGGFFSSMFDNFAYGLYFNRGAGAAGSTYGTGGNFVAPGLRAQSGFVGLAGTTATNLIPTQRPVDFFIGGDTGIKWGFHAAWAYARKQGANLAGTTIANVNQGSGELTNRYWHFDFGAQVMGLEPFVGATMFSKYQNTLNSTEVDQGLDEFNIGARYKYEGWTPYVVFKKYLENGNASSTAGVPNRTHTQVRMNTYGIGVGHDTKVADGIHILKHIGVFYNSTEDSTTATELFKDYKEYIVPINVAIEADATSWWTLRAGATFDFLNTRTFAHSAALAAADVGDRTDSQAGTTRFRIGSTFKFGKLHVDSGFGSGGTYDGSAIGFDANTFADVSLSYHW